MLKIKGLKKKKKGKKGKHKEDDLFDPEELEQYRREHQQKLESNEASEAAGEGTSSSEKSEEWKKFQALTAGVDDILKKTQGDLNRIKETSYFQRKPPGPSVTEHSQKADSSKKPETKSKRWTKFEDGSIVVDEELEEQPVEDKGDDKSELEPEQPPLEEDEDESEQDEDIFDTSYVAVVESGNVKLAYIPDSPIEEDTGPDPFDTSIVDKVIKVDPKKRNLVSLGCAVEVLTGKVDKPIPIVEALPKKRKRPKNQDLLLGSFEELDTVEQPEGVLIEEQPPKSILDEEPEFVPDEIDLSINFAKNLPPASPLLENKDLSVTKYQNKEFPRAIAQEFDVVGGKVNDATVTNVEIYDDLDYEFSALAQESVLKEGVKALSEVNVITHFEETVEVIDFENDDDPFDTSFAANVLPGRFELKLIEEEILLTEHEFPKISKPTFLDNIPSVRLNDAGNEHNFLEEDQIPLSFKHRDLLGGSTTDLTKISDCPIEPVAPKHVCEDLIYSDPFDTSVVDVLVAPGKTELKFLEKELLDGVTSQVDNDKDFDPRADSPPKCIKPLARPDQLPVGEKRLSIPKVVAFNINTLQAEADLLTVNQEENSKVSKPLTPYYANPDEVDSRPSCERESNFADPFDTSFVSHAPGKAELKLIESELVVENNLKRSLSDPNFDPREETDLQNSIEKRTTHHPQTNLQITIINQPSEEPVNIQLDILSGDSLITAKLHTPVLPKKIEEVLDKFDYTDPFDTSNIQNVLPGKAELKLLESELINSSSSIKRSYTDPDFNPRDSPKKEPLSQESHKNLIDHSEDAPVFEKPLTPQSATSKVSFDLSEDIDPFDTSCVENLVPSKAELKLLESELFN